MKISSHDVVTLLVSIGSILILARLAAEWAKRLKLPTVLGELSLGILLGPTVLGQVYPELVAQLFPQSGPVKLVMDGITQLAVMMWLFVSGLEVHLDIIKKQRKVVAATSLCSMIIPFALGFCTVWYIPGLFNMGEQGKLIYALFFASAMAVSAIPVITRILMDVGMYQTKVGMIVLAAATFCDIVGWLAFSVVLSMAGKTPQITNVAATAAAITVFTAMIFFVGKPVIGRILPWVQKNMSWPGGALSICLGLGAFGAAFTEFIGLHAVLGAFLVGIAIGDSQKLRSREREIIYQFTASVLAPLFFVSIGLRVNFMENFDPLLVGVVVILACVCKVLGGALGAKLSGLSNDESIAVGFGLNARGVMEIILGKLALDAGLIDLKMLVAMIVVSMATTMLSGPVLKRFAVRAQLESRSRPITAHGAGAHGG